MSDIEQLLAYLGLGLPVRQTAVQNKRPSLRKIVYLHFGSGMEAQYFPKIGYQGLPFESDEVIDIFDISSLWKTFTDAGQNNKGSLDHVMHTWYDADTYNTKSYHGMYTNEMHCIHNAGNDAYWQLRILLEVLVRYQAKNGDLARRMGLSHDFYGNVVFNSIDFEEWALAGQGAGHWQEIGITILDTKDLKNRAITETCSLLQPYHFANKLYNAQIQNAGRYKAIGVWCRRKCRPEAFKHGRTCWIHHDLAATIVKKFSEIPSAGYTSTYLDNSVTTLMRSNKNKGVSKKEAEQMFGKGLGWGIKGYRI